MLTRFGKKLWLEDEEIIGVAFTESEVHLFLADREEPFVLEDECSMADAYAWLDSNKGK